MGRELAKLHVGYEDVERHRLEWLSPDGTAPDFRVGEKSMRYKEGRVDLTRSGKFKVVEEPGQRCIIVNDTLALNGIPAEVEAYQLGNRSAVAWVVDQYRIKTDKRSGITQDPNDPERPRYIVELIERVVTVSLRTNAAVGRLPETW